MEKDFTFTLQINVLRDGQIELATNELNNYIGQVKRTVCVNLSLNEYDEYLKRKPWLDRELYLRKLALDLIQK